jgi:recombination associated protein RdgC
MFFRNLSFFRFPEKITGAIHNLENALEKHPLKPVGPLEFDSRGFVTVMGREGEAMTHSIAGCTWLALGTNSRLLPSAVVNAALANKVAEIEAKEGRKLGGKARKQLKDDLIHEMLPKAFVKEGRLSASIDTDHNFIVVDASSKKAAEGMVSAIREALGTFPAVPVVAAQPARLVLTRWLKGEPMPDGLALGDECELKDPIEGGAVVKATRHELDDNEEINKHLEAGMLVSKLALTFNDTISFVLGEDLIVRKLKFLAGAVESLENTERDSLAAELDARYSLFSAEVAALFSMLEEVFEIEKAE